MSDDVYRALFGAYPDALIVADAAGTIVLANPAAAALLGYRVDELVGLGIEALVPDAIRPRHAAWRSSYAQHPRTRPMGTQMELVARRRDGSEVMVEIALSPLETPAGLRVVAAIRDIGAYPRVRQALQRARYSEHLAQFGRHAVDARDPRSLLQQASATAAAALQAEAAAVLLLEPGRTELRVAATAGGPEAEGARLPYAADGWPGVVLAQARTLAIPVYRDEQRYAVPPALRDGGMTGALAAPILDRGRAIGLLGVQTRAAREFGADETQFLESLANLLATALQRAQSEEALSHAARLESVGQLTGGIAHDFNNLLTVIQGNLQVLEDLPALAQDPFAQQMVGAAMRASRRGAELTGKLLAFSRRQVLQPSTVDVAQLLESLAEMLRRTVDQRIEIGVEIEAPCPPVRADAGQLEAALLNIAINARDAMPDGGRLAFRARAGAAVTSGLDDPSAGDEAYVSISIADNGSGMPDAVKERAFEPFYTTKGAGRGTGLGLATVYGFVKQSRGTVGLDSAPGHGTTVTLVLPRAWPEARAAEPAPAGGAGQVPPGLRVLLVEDDAAVRAVVRDFLVALGCRVTEAAHAEHALLALQPGAPVDLLLSDVALGPGLRGTELAQRAQALRPGLPVLLMSGYALDAVAAPSLAWQLLRKPFGRDELARALERVLAQA